MRSKYWLIVCGALIWISSAIVALADVTTISPERIKHHIYVLADDSLEGRRVGDPGEMAAANYIIEHFKNLGLEPAGDDGSYLQSFEFTREIRPGENNTLKIAGKSYLIDSTFIPMESSQSGKFSFKSLVYVGYGIESDSLNHHDYADKDVDGKAVLIARYSPDGNDPHGDYYMVSSMDSKIVEATKRNAAAIFFFTPEGEDDNLQRGPVTHVTTRDIPIVFLKRAVFTAKHTTPEELAKQKFELTVDMQRVKDTGYNVIGALYGDKDSARDKIVVVGAHYDHLGWGGRGTGSTFMDTSMQIHNGADDNASGTAGVMELAEYFSSQKSEMNYSILFMGFSGEEFGLLGSNYWVKGPTVPLSNINFMVNMDMIGRLNREKGIALMGVGTSPTFKEYFENYEGDLKLNTQESGSSPSDNTAFYNSDIPVLFFFTGQHEDYHKPSDDADKIDYEGEADVLRLVAAVTDSIAGMNQELAFERTKDDAPGASPRFTVTLGVMPDYIYEGEGLHIDGVTEGKPAHNAGILKGDVVVQMGEYPIADIYAYMAALARFKTGDSTTVEVMRDGERLKLPLVF